MSEEIDLFTEKINNDSEILFDKFFELMEKDNSVKLIFYNLIYSDLIPEKKRGDDLDIKYIFYDPLSILESELEEIHDKVKNSNVNVSSFLKESLLKKREEIKRKKIECKKYIELIKKDYADIYIRSFLPLDKPSKLIFDNNDVLLISDVKNNNILSEFFVRFIFSSIIDINNFDKDEFYNNEDNALSYFNIKDDLITVKPFDKIAKLSRFWIVYLLIFDNLFKKSINYENLFNKELFIKLLKDLIKLNVTIKKPDAKKNNKQKKKRRKGGKQNDALTKVVNIVAKKQNTKGKNTSGKNTKEKEDDKLKSTKNNLLDILKKVNVTDSTTFYSIFVNPYIDIMIDYFDKNINGRIKKSSNGEIKIDSSLTIDNPFNLTEKYKITYFLKESYLKEIEKYHFLELDKTNDLKSIFDKNKIEIFITLNLNLQNQIETFDFILEVKNKILLIYHYLFQVKYKLYNNYIELINRIFELEENNKQNGNRKENGNNTKNGNKQSSKKNSKNKNQLVIVKEETTFLKNKNDKKALELDNEIKKRLIENYKKRMVD
jgi:hypothetical protein